MPRPILPFLFITGLLFAVAGSGVKSTLTFVDTESVITVNNQPITVDEFARAKKKNPNLTESQLISLMIDNLLLLQRAEELGLIHSDRVIRKVIVQHMVEQEVKKVLNEPLDDHKVYAFYQDNLPLFTPPDQYQVQLASFENDDQQCSHSLKIKEQWQQTKTLGDEWRAHLLDQPISKSLHSEVLVYRQLGNRLAKLVTQLNIGEISDPVLTQQGCLLMQLIDSSKSNSTAFEDIKSQVISEYRVMTRKKALADLLSELRDKSEIKFAEDIAKVVAYE